MTAERTIDRIEDGVVVALAYRLHVEGEMVEEVRADDPLEYLHGAENIVPGLERALTGLQAGASFSITLQPEEAYGPYDPELVEAVVREEFEELGELTPGMEIEMIDDDGDVMEVVVREITETAVMLDFNPPLAGKVLDYDIQVVALRTATEDELEQGFPESLLDEMYDDEDFEDDED